MKGNEKIIEKLNGLLSEELTAINQYMVHSEMCSNWNYERLHKAVEKRAIDEMKHAEKLIDRILFLEGVPEIARYDVIRVGTDVKEQLENDLVAGKDTTADVQALQTARNNMLAERVKLAQQVVALLSPAQRTQVSQFMTQWRSLKQQEFQLFKQYSGNASETAQQ